MSLSEVDMKTVRAALQKAGYDFIGPTDSTVCGSIEIFQLGLARQGKSVGVFNLQRQAKAASTGCVPTSLKETFDSWKATKVSAGKAAMIFDEQGDVLCSVLILKDKNGAAKTLLDNLVVSP